MRESLIPGLVSNIAYNANRKHKSLKIFERGKTYHRDKSKIIESNKKFYIAFTTREIYLYFFFTILIKLVFFIYIKLVYVLIIQLSSWCRPPSLTLATGKCSCASLCVVVHLQNDRTTLDTYSFCSCASLCVVVRVVVRRCASLCCFKACYVYSNEKKNNLII